MEKETGPEHPAFCYICQESSENLVPIVSKTFDDGVEPALGVSASAQALVLVKHFWFELDELTKEFICAACWQKVEDFHRFYLKVEKVHEHKFTFTLVDVKQEEQNHELALEHEPKTAESSVSLAEERRSIDVVLCCETGTKDERSLTKERETQSSLELEQHCCEYCDSTCTSSLLLKSHMYINHSALVSTNNVEDENCQNFKEDDLKVHEENHQFSCDKCNALFNKAWKLNKHLRKEHPRIETKRREDTTHKSIGVPTLEVEPNLEEKSVQKLKSNKKSKVEKLDRENALIAQYCRMQCDKCLALFVTFNDLKTHSANVHDCKGFAFCCDKKFYLRNRLLEHAQVHANPNHFQCDQCQKVCPDGELLKRHKLKIHTPDDEKNFCCDKCSKKFAHKHDLKRHLEYHVAMETKQFQCQHCDNYYGNSSLLNVHIKTSHATSFEFVCDTCAKGFNQRSQFLRHLKEHDPKETGKRYQCPECSKWFRKGSIRLHRLRHKSTNEPVRCDICGKESANKTVHKQHMANTHSEAKFQCQLCDKSFKRALNLKEHVASLHSGEMLYTCPHCPMTFKSNANMHSHRKKLHYQEWLETRQKRLEAFTRQD
ncbi:transcription factor grauzone-like [Uranotaenia lowii]|uniref:transcription factor grauzone-like n=1 Tax=Uranotaenia lowii TaxID=190385 RepID=UPI00247908D4|nr:transcription factor grauzone-like [Uranotaenia lowii]